MTEVETNVLLHTMVDLYYLATTYQVIDKPDAHLCKHGTGN